MTTRCKIVCQAVTKTLYADGEFGYESRFSFVTSGSPENEQFYKWTPGGEVRVAITKNDVFVPGKQYYLDFVEA
jgi:hypothetical protein